MKQLQVFKVLNRIHNQLFIPINYVVNFTNAFRFIMSKREAKGGFEDSSTYIRPLFLPCLHCT